MTPPDIFTEALERAWAQIEHKLVYRKLQEATVDFWKEHADRLPNKPRGDRWPDFEKWVDLDLELTKKWVEAVYAVYLAVWEKDQGRRRTKDFVQAVLKFAILPQIQARVGTAKSKARTLAKKTNRSYEGPLVHRLAIGESRLIKQWSEKIANEARELPWEQSGLSASIGPDVSANDNAFPPFAKRNEKQFWDCFEGEARGSFGWPIGIVAPFQKDEQSQRRAERVCRAWLSQVRLTVQAALSEVPREKASGWLAEGQLRYRDLLVRYPPLNVPENRGADRLEGWLCRLSLTVLPLLEAWVGTGAQPAIGAASVAPKNSGRRPPSKSDPDIIKRRAIVAQHPNMSAAGLCELFDEWLLPLPRSMEEMSTWVKAYRAGAYRHRIDTLISKDRKHRPG